MTKKRKIVYSVFAVILLWICAGIIDFLRVHNQEKPIFCIQAQRFKDENHSSSHYTGLGYSFDTYKHPITGNIEFIFYLFSVEVDNNMTN